MVPSTKISIKKGDITTAEVDAIVNAANPGMLGGGGVDGAIHRAAGPELLKACKEVPAVNGVRCPHGEARITRAGNLNAKYVIHTAGPIYAMESNPAALLESAYANSCNLALEHGCESIAFPAISCGVYGYPHEEAASIAIDVCSRPEYTNLQIEFYLFDTDLYQLFQRVLNKSLNT